MDESKKYYVYVHYKKGTNTPFYVGKGCGNRAYIKYYRNKWWNNVVSSHGYDVEIIERSNDEQLMYDLEIYWIAQFKSWGFKLTNLTDGGGNNLNFKNPLKGKSFKEIYGEEKSKTVITKLSHGKLGINNPMYGKVFTDEDKEVRRKSCTTMRMLLDYNTGIYYESITEASNNWGINRNTLANYLSDKTSTMNKTPLRYV